ncbi:hypothetical protein J437_LFUL005433 [Ladona fulva]|uniref:Phospholysine phosphohistidine inorganic pyrophosphate phosphatase n=1 Tax=Ladona fulva TaxID=123851 RepID=A0A8K0JWT9_LADFU|nr:hypothetical protein J437_LFUL005433 [Ladona fulva]
MLPNYTVNIMAWLRSPIKGVMLDISGVLKNGNVAIPGSIEAVQRLRKCGLKLRFVTNETQLSRHDLTEKLRRIGFQLHENEVFPPAPAMVETLKGLRLNPMLLVHPKVLIDFKDVDQSNPNCVVVGDAAEHFTYERMNSAFRLLMELKNPKLFTLGRGRYYLEEDGLCLDVGCFTTALEFATGLKAEVVGKPSSSFFATPLKDMGLDSSEVVMIGDDIESDVGGAQKCGMRGVLVRTGKFRPERDENHPNVKPDAVVNDLAQGVELILSSESFKSLIKHE